MSASDDDTADLWREPTTQRPRVLGTIGPTPLPVRRLGESGLETTRFALGLAALGRPAYITPHRQDDFPEGRSIQEMANRTHTMLDAAFERGIRSFDAARSYGQAEGFLADWLANRDLEPGQVHVSSKWGYSYVGQWMLEAEQHEVKSHDLSTFVRQWTASRKVLWSHLDLYQVHSLTPDSPLFDDEPLLGALLELKEQYGVSLGVTVTGPQQAATIRRVMKLERGGRRLFDTVQATFNVLETSAEPGLAEAHAEGMGVIIKEGLANGRLTERGDGPELGALRQAATSRGWALDTLALAAVLSKPWADVVLSGAVTRAQLESNLAALDVAWDEEMEAELAGLRMSPEAYWRERSARPWA